MIASLRGRVQRLGQDEVVLEVGGLGLRVFVPASTAVQLPPPGELCSLFTKLIVREDNLALYGFLDPEQLEVFELLLQVNGVGPRLALAVLSHISAESLRSAVARQELGSFRGIPGVGQKTAEKILFHLKDRIGSVAAGRAAEMDAQGDVLAALTALGYTFGEAQAAIQALPTDGEQSLEERVRLALQHFAHP